MNKTCVKCGSELDRINLHTAQYCLSCSKDTEREKTRLRVKRYREKVRGIYGK